MSSVTSEGCCSGVWGGGGGEKSPFGEVVGA